MAGIWRTARVFISSTFRDMHAERDHLVKVIFPELRERLLPHRVYLDDVDLRWGITEEESKNDKVLDLCLQQIDECRPFFIGILGERYGWVPTTPLSLEAARRFEKYGRTQIETGQSVTELEILFGVLLMDPRMKGRSFFYFRDPRFLNTVPSDRRREVRHQFQEFPTQAEIQQLGPKRARREAAIRRLKLRRLKQKIRAVRGQGYPVFANYPGSWDTKAFDRPTKTQGRLVELDEFGRQVRVQLWEAIKAEFKLPDEPPTPVGVDEAARLAAEADDQDRFVESRLRVYVGREEVQRELVAYALGNEPKPCLLTGPSGSGKSAALAQFVARAAEDLPGVPLIAHFIGASPRSTALRDMLKRLCTESFDKLLKTERQVRLAGITTNGEDAEEQRRAIEEEYVIPEEIDPLVTTWRKFLRMVPEQHRVILVLDALNQLEEGDRAQDFWWLPPDLGPHVKVIGSSIIDPAAPEAEGDPVAQAFQRRPFQGVRIGGLATRDRVRILRQVPSLSAKTLEEKQVRTLLENPVTENPLYLKVALEELRGFGVFEELNYRIAALPRPGLEDAVYERARFSSEAMSRAGDPLTALFTQMIQRLESEFSSSLVHDVLTILAAARRGLSELEIQEFLADHPDVDDLFPVLRQLRPNLMNRSGLLGFYHAGLDQAVRRYYLHTKERQRTAHRRLAECFARQDFFLESLEAQRDRSRRMPPTPRPANVRKVDELPWQWLEAEQWDHLAGLFKDLFFLEAKSEAGYLFDLATDFTRTIEAIGLERPAGRLLRLLSQGIGADLQFLTRHPTALFQCLWNRCRWHDSPVAAQHYITPPRSAPVTRPAFRIREPKKLIVTLELPGLTNFPVARSILTMPGKAAKTIITERQQEILRTFSRSVTAPSRLRQRASIIVLAFDGLLNEDIAERVGLTHRQVGRWRRRWAKAWNRLIDIECCESRTALRRALVAVLTDEPRPGAPAKFTPEQVTQILAVACEPPEKSGRPITHWTAHELTDEVIQRGIVASISPSQVSRYLREAALQPHKSRYWLNTTEKDPARFEEQVKAVCDTYLAAPEQARTKHTHTVSVDEMTGLQALERTAPDKAMIAGKSQLIEFEYARHGTLCLIGNLVVTTGELLRPTIGPTRTEDDFASHIEQTMATDPEGSWVFIVDNLNIHCSESLVKLVAEASEVPKDLGKKGVRGVLKSVASRQAFLSEPSHRIRFVYLPKHSSWLNQIETVFGVIMRKVIRRGSFTSVEDLRTKLLSFITYFNRVFAKPFRWTYTGRPLMKSAA